MISDDSNYADRFRQNVSKINSKPNNADEQVHQTLIRNYAIIS